MPDETRADEAREQAQADQGISSLEEFFSRVRASCGEHATRKGYLAGSDNILGRAMTLFGIEADHAIGEILAKLLEFKQGPRKVLAEKIAGWAWRLWLTAAKD